jgi:hypothetical protein
MGNDYAKIETRKLEKIHYMQLKVIKDREEKNQLGGLSVKFKNPIQFQNDMQHILEDIFEKADKEYKGQPEDLVGMRYFIAVLYALPLDKLKAQEIAVQKELKKRREIRRQKLDAGKIDNLIKEGS